MRGLLMMLARRSPVMLVVVAAVFALPACKRATHVDAGRLGTPEAVVEAPAASAASPIDERHALAACHPHLIHAPQDVPQVETVNLPSPGQAHMKIHLWVNGGGLVVRSRLVSGELGSAVEQQAAAAYMRGLHFSVPENADCNRREIELVGDVFEAPTTQGDWLTMIRVYPRYTLDGAGGVTTRD